MFGENLSSYCCINIGGVVLQAHYAKRRHATLEVAYTYKQDEMAACVLITVADTPHTLRQTMHAHAHSVHTDCDVSSCYH